MDAATSQTPLTRAGPALARSTYLALALLSAAALAFEITLTRLFSVTQWYHFAFLAVSVALLGYGASGTALTLAPRWTSAPTGRRVALLALCFSTTVVGAYLSLNHLPFDSYRIAWERIQLLYLLLYYLALTMPFFCAGLVTGLLLAAHPHHASPLYAANLVGSAAGGLVPLLTLPWLGEGAVLVIAALGLLSALAFSLQSHGAVRLPKRACSPTLSAFPARLPVFGLCLGAGLALLLLAVWLPGPLSLRLSPYKGLSQVLRFPDARSVYQRWNAVSRIDRVSSSAIRSAPGLSLAFPGRLPPQDALFVDGDDLSPVILSSSRAADFTRYLPIALAHRLRPGARVLLVQPRGGLALGAALDLGASSVVAVESNPLVVEAVGDIYRDRRVTVETEDPRTYVRRSRDSFDLVHLALSDAYRPVTSGAFSLGERYDLTVEAFADYLARLRTGGLLVVERWLQLPPSETLRAGATAVEALRRVGVTEPSAQVVVVRGWQVGLILVKNGPFTEDELAAVRTFCRDQGLDLVAMPGLQESEVNHFNVFPEPVYYRAFRQLLADPHALYQAQTYDVRPPTDDRPFFFHFFRWGQAGAILGQLGRSWQPWGGSGYFVLLALLLLASVASLSLILLPLWFRRRQGRALAGPRARVLAYFGLLGLGFLFVEIPLMQRFILFLGQPLYAFAAVLAALLFSSGLGSLSAARFPPRRILALLVLAILVLPTTHLLLLRWLLGAPLGVRLLATTVGLAPLGFLMGIPFPAGLAWLRERAPGLVPWAWAINGCASVLASVLAALIALSAGFTWVLLGAALAYAGAYLALR